VLIAGFDLIAQGLFGLRLASGLGVLKFNLSV
jgi:hypothetical protein